MSQKWQLGGRLEAREESKETLWPFIKSAFAVSADDGLVCDFEQLFSAQQNVEVNALKERAKSLLSLELGLFIDGERVGAFLGRQVEKGVFHMGTSVFLPEHQGKGHYGRLLDFVLKWAKDHGFIAVDSHHNPCNKKILIAKLRKDFYIAGTETTPTVGQVVKLIHYFDPRHREMFEFRSGYRGPSGFVREVLPGLLK